MFLSGTVYRLLRCVSLATLVTVLASLPAFAQSTSSGSSLTQPQPHPVAPPAPKDQEQFVVYWTTEPGWDTELLLRNNLEGSNLTVTPAIRTSNGVETALPSVTIATGDVATVDLRDALNKAAANLGSSWGSLVLRYRSIVNGGLYSSVMVKADGRPIAFHLDGFGRGTTYETGAREGIWWLPRPEVTDWLILTNSSDQPIQPRLVLYDASGKASQQALTLAARETQRLSIRALLQQSGLQGDHGGFKIEITKGARFLDSAYVLFEQSGGFSAVMKMFRHDPRTTLASRSFSGGTEWTTRAPMLALSNPDPALGLPPGTTLQPTLFLRNTSARTVAAQLRFDWRTASAAGKSAPISLNLQPNETQVVDVTALQDGKTLPIDANWASVILSAPVFPDDVLAVAASYDQTGQYGAQTPFSDQLASHWEGGRWEVDGTHNSLSTIINGGNKPVIAELTILFNQGQGQYQLQRTLAPEEQMFVDFGKLIHDQVPDKNGLTLPHDLMSGAYRVRDLTDSTTASLYEGKVIVDKTFGHVSYGCMVCCGPNNPWMSYNPLAIVVGGNALQGVQAVNSCNSKLQTITGDFPTWWTDNTAIATATGYQINGVSVGTTNNNAQSVVMYFGPKEDSGGGACDNSQQQVNAPTSVTPKILLGGSNGTDVTDKTTSVVVGQQIALYASYTLPSGSTINSQNWSIPGAWTDSTKPQGTTVGGFNTGGAGGPATITINQQSTTFYWTIGTSGSNTNTVIFTLNFGSSQIVTAQTTFTVLAPTSPIVTIPPNGAIQIATGPNMEFGDPASTPGVKFSGSVTPPLGYPGKILWVQVINKSNYAYIPAGGSCGESGLDNQVPYSTSSTTSDSPETPLFSDDNQVTWDFGASMFLMWRPGLQNDIPVPLGYVTWQFYVDTKQDSNTQTWTIQTDSKGSAGSFVASGLYPAWGATLSNKVVPPCQK